MTSQEIAQEVYSALSSADREYIAGLSENELPKLHHGLGTAVRNQYLWGKTKPQNAIVFDTDDICAEIIKAIWEIAKSENRQAD